MRQILWILIFTVVSVFCTKTPSEYDQWILQLWEGVQNKSRLIPLCAPHASNCSEEKEFERIATLIKEDAEKYDLTGDEYFRVCTEQNFVLSKKEELDFILEDALDRHPIIFRAANSTNEVLKVVEKEAPKIHKIIRKRQALFTKHRASLDAPAQKFLIDFGESFINTMVKMSTMNYSEMNYKLHNTSKTIRSKHAELPQSSKYSLERTFCFKTTLRRMALYETKWHKINHW